MFGLKPIKFPRDESAHHNIIEWWYFNGHLQDKNGKKYAFMDCLFKADAKKVNIPFLKKIPYRDIYFAHSLLSDLSQQKTEREVQYLTFLSQDSFQRPELFVNYRNPLELTNNYTNYAIEKTAPQTYRIKTQNFDLTLKSTKPPLLEGGEGHIKVCGRKSYYYSLTNLSAHGLIKTDQGYSTVTGKAWMDHQWADVSYRQDCWTWFALQLTNQTEIMACQYVDKKNQDTLVDIISATGQHRSPTDLIITPGQEIFRSKLTKAEYPLSWLIEIPSQKISLKVKALIKEQEMVFGTINYWEGPLAVSGSINGRRVRGQGFAELVGYPSQYNNLSLVKTKIKNILDREIHRSKTIFRKKRFLIF
ncbi:MAG TPA: lipocalin-like domain-containing protein [bacterium]|nr:lipocalin-like domain-containing protein [bacterium]HNS34218.1 lipocalin-like domain-containing protein [bacterium]HNZ73511.1 lipocalin-like domain-containing protein [bacterium]HQA63815.1 lipocalin-like domain-containing protein [bacterium]